MPSPSPPFSETGTCRYALPLPTRGLPLQEMAGFEKAPQVTDPTASTQPTSSSQKGISGCHCSAALLAREGSIEQHTWWGLQVSAAVCRGHGPCGGEKPFQEGPGSCTVTKASTQSKKQMKCKCVALRYRLMLPRLSCTAPVCASGRHSNVFKQQVCARGKRLASST